MLRRIREWFRAARHEPVPPTAHYLVHCTPDIVEHYKPRIYDAFTIVEPTVYPGGLARRTMLIDPDLKEPVHKTQFTAMWKDILSEDYGIRDNYKIVNAFNFQTHDLTTAALFRLGGFAVEAVNAS